MDKILLVTNIPTPYRIPLFNELDRQMRGKGFGLKVIFGADGYRRRKWKVEMSECRFDYEILHSRSLPYRDPEKTSFTYSGLYGVIKREAPAAVITNAFSLATVKLWLRSFFKKNRYIIWSGAIERGNERDSSVRRLMRKALIRRASGFVAYGTRAKEYLVSLGAERGMVTIAINTVDTDFFRETTEALRRGFAKRDGKKRLLYIGHMTRGKRIDLLFRAVRLLLDRRGDFVLQIVGDGPEKEALMRLAENLGISSVVSFEGFRQKEDIPAYLAGADCFLFPSEYDIWGLVLVEAMAAGVPCIASVRAGATADLIEDGVTGFAMDYADVQGVAGRISWVLDNPSEARKMGIKASRFIEDKVNIGESARGFVKAVEAVLLPL